MKHHFSSSDFLDEAGRFFKELRLKRGLTQDKAAELMGIAQSQISKLETADRNVKLSALVEMLAFYDVDHLTIHVKRQPSFSPFLRHTDADSPQRRQAE
jgi:transcriptional regulator with XRE-family HTH domain